MSMRKLNLSLKFKAVDEDGLMGIIDSCSDEHADDIESIDHLFVYQDKSDGVGVYQGMIIDGELIKESEECFYAGNLHRIVTKFADSIVSKHVDRFEVRKDSEDYAPVKEVGVLILYSGDRFDEVSGKCAGRISFEFGSEPKVGEIPYFRQAGENAPVGKEAYALEFVANMPFL